MSCNSCKNFHRITSLTYTENTSLVLTVTNASNLTNKSKFCLIVNKPINQTVTGSPVQVYVTGLNGQGAIPVYTKFGNSYPLYSDLLSKYYTRLCNGTAVLHGNYINDGTNSYVILNDVPRCNCTNVTGGK